MFDAFVIAFVVLSIVNALFRRRTARLESGLKRVLHIPDSPERTEKVFVIVAIMAPIIGALLLMERFF
jgi:hypothetical protein